MHSRSLVDVFVYADQYSVSAQSFAADICGHVQRNNPRDRFWVVVAHSAAAATALAALENGVQTCKGLIVQMLRLSVYGGIAIEFEAQCS